jgi:hypothetical protein
MVAFILGLTIVSIVDKRLGDIKIKIPKQNVIVKLPDNKNHNNRDSNNSNNNNRNSRNTGNFEYDINSAINSNIDSDDGNRYNHDSNHDNIESFTDSANFSTVKASKNHDSNRDNSNSKERDKDDKERDLRNRDSRELHETFDNNSSNSSNSSNNGNNNNNSNNAIQNVKVSPFCDQYANNLMTQSSEFNSVKQQLPWENGDNANSRACKINHDHRTCGMGRFCHYGPTNYPDPRDMTKVDRRIFKASYPANLTLQDYINWLWLYQDDTTKLSADHLQNLMRLQRGENLEYQFGVLPPSAKRSPPFTAADYFEQLYDKDDQIAIRSNLNSITGPLMGYNYEDYSEFNQNFDIYGSSGQLMNPDLGDKVDAKRLSAMVTPRISTSIEKSC